MSTGEYENIWNKSKFIENYSSGMITAMSCYMVECGRPTCRGMNFQRPTLWVFLLLTNLTFAVPLVLEPASLVVYGATGIVPETN